MELFSTPLDLARLGALFVRFAFNLLFIWIIIHKLYYPRSQRRDYYFTFALISISVFFLIYLLGGVKIKTGFVLGLFAIFGIIRYRTETMSVRDMTYLFVIITVSIINALAEDLSLVELLITNIIFIAAIKLCESNKSVRHLEEKYVIYDRIELVTPDKHDELIADLETRIGVKIVAVQVGAIDFLKDTAMLKISYESGDQHSNTANKMFKLPKPDNL